MKRIGILLSSKRCSRALHACITKINNSPYTELFFLLNNDTNKNSNFILRFFQYVKSRGINKAFDIIIFKIIAFLERITILIMKKSELDIQSELSLKNLIKNK